VIFWDVLYDSCDILILCDLNNFVRIFYFMNSAGFLSLLILLSVVRGAFTGRDLNHLHLCLLTLDYVVFGNQSDFRLHPPLE